MLAISETAADAVTRIVAAHEGRRAGIRITHEVRARSATTWPSRSAGPEAGTAWWPRRARGLPAADTAALLDDNSWRPRSSAAA